MMKPFFSQQGYSLMELMIAVGIASILMLGLSFATIRIKTDIMRVTGIASRDGLSRRLRMTLNSRHTLIQTVNRTPADPVNTAMKNCLNPTAANYNNCSSNVFYGINLYDQSGSLIAGTPQSPVYYTRDGNLCPGGASDPQCVFFATATFRAQCTSIYLSIDQIEPSPTCEIPDSFEVTVMVDSLDSGHKSTSFSFISDPYDIDFR